MGSRGTLELFVLICADVVGALSTNGEQQQTTTNNKQQQQTTTNKQQQTTTSFGVS